MAVKPLSALVGPNHGVRPAPNLTWANDVSNAANYVIVSGINAAGGLTTILSLTGRFEILVLTVQNLASNGMDQIRLTIDGAIIWDEDGLITSGTAFPLIGAVDGDHGPQGISCDSSFLFEIEMNADTSIDVIYWVRPIL